MPITYVFSGLEAINHKKHERHEQVHLLHFVVKLAFGRHCNKDTEFPPTTCGNDRRLCPSAVVGHPATFKKKQSTTKTSKEHEGWNLTSCRIECPAMLRALRVLSGKN